MSHHCCVFKGFFKIYFLIGGILLYNVVLVSAVQQCESAIPVHVPSLSWASLTSPHPTPLGRHSTGLGSLCYTAAFHQPFILQMVVYTCQRHFLHSSHSIFPHCVHKSIPYLSLHSFPKNSFINTIFLDSMYMFIPYIFHIYIPYIQISRLIFFFLSDLLCITGSRFIYLSRTDSNSLLVLRRNS